MTAEDMLEVEEEENKVMFDIVEQKGVTRRIIYIDGEPVEENYYACLGADVPVEEAYNIMDRSPYAKLMVRRDATSSSVSTLKMGEEHDLYYVKGWKLNKKDLMNTYNIPFVRAVGKHTYVVFATVNMIPAIKEVIGHDALSQNKAKVEKFKIPFEVAPHDDIRTWIIYPPKIKAQVMEEAEAEEDEEELSMPLDLKVTKININNMMGRFPNYGLIIKYGWDVIKTKRNVIVKINKSVSEEKCLTMLYLIKSTNWDISDTPYVLAHTQKIKLKLGKFKVVEEDETPQKDA